MDTATAQQLSRLESAIGAIRMPEKRATIAAEYTTNASQSIPNNTATIVNFEDLTFDTHSCVTVGAAWRFIAPITGYYRVSAAILYASSTAWATGEAAGLMLYKNGAQHRFLDRKDNINSGGVSVFVQLSGDVLVSLAAGDYIDVRTIQLSGGALALFNDTAYNYIAINRV